MPNAGYWLIWCTLPGFFRMWQDLFPVPLCSSSENQEQRDCVQACPCRPPLSHRPNSWTMPCTYIFPTLSAETLLEGTSSGLSHQSDTYGGCEDTSCLFSLSLSLSLQQALIFSSFRAEIHRLMSNGYRIKVKWYSINFSGWSLTLIWMLARFFIRDGISSHRHPWSAVLCQFFNSFCRSFSPRVGFTSAETTLRAIQWYLHRESHLLRLYGPQNSHPCPFLKRQHSEQKILNNSALLIIHFGKRITVLSICLGGYRS